MIFFPPAKINIGLYVTHKRSDGYHDIESVFYPIGLRDVLEVIPHPSGLADQPEMTCSGIPVAGEADSNLVVRAYHLIRARREVPAVKIWLHKRIPLGAGLGGGSSDGTAMLMLLDQLFSLKIGREEMREMALQLGSDCPFFLNPAASLAQGRGEQLTPISLDLGGFYLYLFHSGEGISTAHAYRNVRIGLPAEPLEGLLRRGVGEWKGWVENRFEPFAINQQPVIGHILECLNRQGALFSSLTGSGSAVYGLFDRETEPAPEIRPFLIWKEKLSV